MWVLNDGTPFASERTWVRDRDGTEVWVVATRATFGIDLEGRQRLVEPQPAVSRVPRYKGRPGESSLLEESDLVSQKVATDVVVLGAAFAPGGEPVRETTVRLRVGRIDKSLRIYGERTWKRGVLGPRPGRPQPFVRMPIEYERAYGGADTIARDPRKHGCEKRNPIGMGYARRRRHLLGRPAPNIELVGGSSGRSGRARAPGGFGPIARNWEPRLTLAGTYDESWERDRSPLLPLDYEPAFEQCAPEDQQVSGFLRGGERVELWNMTPDGHLAFTLPKVTVGLQTHFYDGTMENHRGALHTLLILPEERQFAMVWHSRLACHKKVNQLRATSVFLKHRLTIPEAEATSGVWTAELHA